MIEEVAISDMETLVEAMKGLSIVGGGYEGEDGIHFELSDGRLLIVTGRFIVGLCRVHKEELH